MPQPSTPPRPLWATPTALIIWCWWGSVLASIGLAIGIRSCCQPDLSASVDPAAQVTAPPPPYGVSRARALEYKKQPEIITTYAWMGYEATTPPRDLVANQWPHFGTIVATEELGPMLAKDGVLIKVVVKKDPAWDAWEPNQ